MNFNHSARRNFIPDLLHNHCLGFMLSAAVIAHTQHGCLTLALHHKPHFQTKHLCNFIQCFNLGVTCGGLDLAQCPK